MSADQIGEACQWSYGYANEISEVDTQAMMKMQSLASCTSPTIPINLSSLQGALPLLDSRSLVPAVLHTRK